MTFKALPKLGQTVALLKLTRWQAEQRGCSAVKVGQNAVAIEIQLHWSEPRGDELDRERLRKLSPPAPSDNVIALDRTATSCTVQ